MSAVLLLGLPGSGKSTVANSLAALGHGSWLSASQVLRDHVDATPAAAGWKRLWRTGHHAPDAEALPVLWDGFTRHTGWVLLDGYPRTTDQLVDFTARGGTLRAAVLLQVTETEAIERLRARAGREGRDDDAEHVARHRVAAERERIGEVLRTLTAQRTSVVVVDAGAPLTEVTDRTLRALLEVRATSATGAALPTSPLP